MHELKPKEQHERILANADREQIVQHLENGDDQEVIQIAVTLARQCDLYVHFDRLWKMRITDLDKALSSERYMRNIFVNKRSLNRDAIKNRSLQRQ